MIAAAAWGPGDADPFGIFRFAADVLGQARRGIQAMSGGHWRGGPWERKAGGRKGPGQWGGGFAGAGVGGGSGEQTPVRAGGPGGRAARRGAGGGRGCFAGAAGRGGGLGQTAHAGTPERVLGGEGLGGGTRRELYRILADDADEDDD